MTREQLQTALTEKFEQIIPEEGGQWLNIKVEASQWPSLMELLRNDEAYSFDRMFCLTCVDWLKHMTVVYHLHSSRHDHTLVVKIDVDRQNPEVATCCHLWRTAEFHEREVYEMFGVHFTNHPDLRLLILPDDWIGRNPMRKDYEDPVNMIKL